MTRRSPRRSSSSRSSRRRHLVRAMDDVAFARCPAPTSSAEQPLDAGQPRRASRDASAPIAGVEQHAHPHARRACTASRSAPASAACAPEKLAAQDAGVDRHRHARQRTAARSTRSARAAAAGRLLDRAAQVGVAPLEQRAVLADVERAAVADSPGSTDATNTSSATTLRNPLPQAALGEVDQARRATSEGRRRTARRARAPRARATRSAIRPSACAAGRAATAPRCRAASCSGSRRRAAARTARRPRAARRCCRARSRLPTVESERAAAASRSSQPSNTTAWLASSTTSARSAGRGSAARPGRGTGRASCSRSRDPAPRETARPPGPRGSSPTSGTSTSPAVCSTTARTHR